MSGNTETSRGAIAGRRYQQLLNLEGMRRITIKEIAETIQKLVENNVKIEYLPARPGDYEGKEASNDKIKRLLGWEPKIDFEEGMKRAIDWYKVEVVKKTTDLITHFKIPKDLEFQVKR